MAQLAVAMVSAMASRKLDGLQGEIGRLARVTVMVRKTVVKPPFILTSHFRFITITVNKL
jgi:hypothetical protein